MGSDSLNEYNPCRTDAAQQKEGTEDELKVKKKKK